MACAHIHTTCSLSQYIQRKGLGNWMLQAFQQSGCAPGLKQTMDRGPWTTPNFQEEIVPVNMKIYRRSGYEKHRLVFIAYVLEGLSRESRLLWDRTTINGNTTNSF